MADLKNTLTQVGEVIIDSTVKDNFDRMMIALKKDVNTTLDLESSYMSKYDIIDKLRIRVNKEVVSALSGSSTAMLLDPTRPLSEIAKVEADYNTLETYINGLSAESFEPPLAPLVETATPGVNIVPTLPYPAVDPRRTGNIVNPKPGTITDVVQKWLLNNGILYGFVLYGTHSLYYLGKDNIKNELKKDPNKLRAIVGRFLAAANIIIDGLTTTATTVIANTYPPPVVSVFTGQTGRLKPEELKRTAVGGLQMHPTAAKWFDIMMGDLKKALNISDNDINFTGGYRSFQGQFDIFDWPRYVSTGGDPGHEARVLAGERVPPTPGALRRKKNTDVAAAFPGTSNHGKGISIDISSKLNPHTDEDRLQAWIRAYGVGYGWSWYEGRSVSERWHFTYDPTKTQIFTDHPNSTAGGDTNKGSPPIIVYA